MKIQDMQGRSENSGYQRVFANNKLGALFSKVQATVISNGNELERIILSKSNLIKNLDDFIDMATDNSLNNGVFVCPKKEIKKSKYAIKDIEPDLLIFVVQRKRICKVIELKDGDNFDTKKSKGEKENLIKCIKCFCCFSTVDL